MAFPDELVNLAVAQGLGVIGGSNPVPGSIFVSARSIVPAGAGPYTSLIETSGSGTDYVQDSGEPAYVWQSLQVAVRATQTPAARDLAWKYFWLFAGIGNEFVGDVWYVDNRPLQQPFDSGLDETGARVKYVFNIVFNKRPS